MLILLIPIPFVRGKKKNTQPKLSNSIVGAHSKAFLGQKSRASSNKQKKQTKAKESCSLR